MVTPTLFSRSGMFASSIVRNGLMATFPRHTFTRSFISTGVILQTTTTTQKTKRSKASIALEKKAKEKAKLDKLKEKAKLNKLKEKAKLDKLKEKEKAKAKVQKEKDLAKKRKDREKQKKLEAKAFRDTPLQLNFQNFVFKFISGNTFAEKIDNFKNLSPAEKIIYEKGWQKCKAEATNHFKPKPKKPLIPYFQFLQKNYHNYSGTVGEISKQIRATWLQLTPEEKAAYPWDKEANVKYYQELKDWKVQRIEDYLKARQTIKDFKFDPKDPGTYE